MYIRFSCLWKCNFRKFLFQSNFLFHILLRILLWLLISCNQNYNTVTTVPCEYFSKAIINAYTHYDFFIQQHISSIHYLLLKKYLKVMNYIHLSYHRITQKLHKQKVWRSFSKVNGRAREILGWCRETSWLVQAVDESSRQYWRTFYKMVITIMTRFSFTKTNYKQEVVKAEKRLYWKIGFLQDTAVD